MLALASLVLVSCGNMGQVMSAMTNGTGIANAVKSVIDAIRNPLNNGGYEIDLDDRVFTYFDLPLRGSLEVRLRLRASYCGRFTLPAVKCEAMYDPQSYARTAAGNVLVTR